MRLDKCQGLPEKRFSRLRAVPGGSPRRVGQGYHIGTEAEDVDPVSEPNDVAEGARGHQLGYRQLSDRKDQPGSKQLHFRPEPGGAVGYFLRGRHPVATLGVLSGETAAHGRHVNPSPEVRFGQANSSEPSEESLAGGPGKRSAGRAFPLPGCLTDEQDGGNNRLAGHHGAEHSRTPRALPELVLVPAKPRPRVAHVTIEVGAIAAGPGSYGTGEPAADVRPFSPQTAVAGAAKGRYHIRLWVIGSPLGASAEMTMAVSELSKVKEFLDAQAKAEKLKRELAQQLRKQILDVQSMVQMPMEELLGIEILSMVAGKPRKKLAAVPAVSTTPTDMPPRTCYLNPEVRNVPRDLEKKVEYLLNLPLNDLVPAVGEPEDSPTDWVRHARPHELEKMKVPNPKWWNHPAITDADRASWRP